MMMRIHKANNRYFNLRSTSNLSKPNYIGNKTSHYAEDTIKHSRFIAFAKYISSIDDVNTILITMKVHKASHCCWAYRIGDIEKCYDDGEPVGSAGRPILTIIKSLDVQNVIVIVLRYFGGTKLGLGGLIRAYGGIARKCILSSPFDTLPIIYTSLDIHTNINDLDMIYSYITTIKHIKIISENHPNSISSSNSSSNNNNSNNNDNNSSNNTSNSKSKSDNSDMNVTIRVNILQDQMNKFIDDINVCSRGRAIVTLIRNE
jgi:uncharacterized YigZ family protein